MFQEDNFVEDNVNIATCIGGGGVEEPSTDYEINLTNYTPRSIPKFLTGSVTSEDRSGEF